VARPGQIFSQAGLNYAALQPPDSWVIKLIVLLFKNTALRGGLTPVNKDMEENAQETKRGGEVKPETAKAARAALRPTPSSRASSSSFLPPHVPPPPVGNPGAAAGDE
jgi:hypothetical protein